MTIIVTVSQTVLLGGYVPSFLLLCNCSKRFLSFLKHAEYLKTGRIKSKMQVFNILKQYNLMRTKLKNCEVFSSPKKLYMLKASKNKGYFLTTITQVKGVKIPFKFSPPEAVLKIAVQKSAKFLQKSLDISRRFLISNHPKSLREVCAV